jgi:tRNA(His) guanylyltransferase
MSEDSFGDRMKLYEMAEAGRKFMPMLPIIARIDGRGFSKFTQGLARPYDKRLSDLMIDTTKFLVHESNACCGYTQSDEITLAWWASTYEGEVFFAGRISKMNSTLAALASVYFYRQISEYGALPEEYLNRIPTFDCRVWNVPNIVEGANAFLWREQDATKNSISMAARAYYEHGELMNKNGSEMQEMLWQKGVNWNDYPSFFKRGTYVQRKMVKRGFTADELAILPERHAAKNNPDLKFERAEYQALDLPPLGKIVNRASVLFLGAEPLMESTPQTL